MAAANMSVTNKKYYYGDSKDLPAPRDILVQDTAQKVNSIKDIVLQTIRTQMPIDVLFKPRLKINLGVFISDQIFLKEIANFLDTFPPNIDSAAIKQHFEKSPLLQRLKQTFNPALMDLFYDACADVMKGRVVEDKMRAAIDGRIFTLKNSLIAQQNPDAILKSQSQNGLQQQSKKEIQEEGAAFIRICLAMHLKMIKGEVNVPFKEELSSVAEQLIPFVRQVTRTYLYENKKYVSYCPDDPLAFRNPIGYNRHGLVAATVIEAALQVLGYNTRLMGRIDLEPKATLATAHNIVEVTGLDGIKYIVDPAYLQFHKDVYTSDSMFPKNPVLVLDERQVATYVEESIMSHWRSTFNHLKDQKTLEKIYQNDQMLLYLLDKQRLPAEIMPTNMEAWARSALTRPWDLKSYHPILSDQGFQEIFNGILPNQRLTYDLIKGMGISSLTTHRTYEEIVHYLDEMIVAGKKINSPEALSLFAQLPRNMRTKYRELLDIDPRTEELDPCINAYFRSIAKTVNPQGRDFRVIYGCSGADATSILESTNANELFFVDLTVAGFNDFSAALKQAQNSPILERERLEKQSNFMSFRLRYSGAQSSFRNNKHFMDDLPLKLLLDLNSIGVDLTQIKLKALENGAVQIDFPWQYFGSSDLKMRSLIFITTDITNPDTYPLLLQKTLEEGVDAFFMKGAFLAPKKYSQFLPGIAKAIKDSGWLMTTDKTFCMDTINPEDCLATTGLNFDLVRAEEPTRLAENIHPPFDPFLEVGILKVERISRTPGTDPSYWTILNLRQKRV